jgi:hypothetical protein
VHYRWHPQFGTEIRIAYREQRRGEDVVVFETPNCSRTVLPAWMLDASVCATMTIGPPRAALYALRREGRSRVSRRPLQLTDQVLSDRTNRDQTSGLVLPAPRRSLLRLSLGLS